MTSPAALAEDLLAEDVDTSIDTHDGGEDCRYDTG